MAAVTIEMIETWPGGRMCAEDDARGMESPRPSRQYAKELMRGIKGRRLVGVALTLLFIWQRNCISLHIAGLH